MTIQSIPLYNHTNGVFMIGVFALVCIGFVVMTVMLFRSGKKK